MSAKAVLATLSGHWAIAPDSPQRSRRIFVDTADWLIDAHGSTLEIDHEGSASAGGPPITLTLRDAKTQGESASSMSSADPRFAADLPLGSPWEDVADWIGDRRLIPQLEFDSRSQRVAILNADLKTTARVILERHSLVHSGVHHTIRLVTVLPVRGYERTAERVAGTLRSAGLLPADGTLVSWALRALHRPSPRSHLGPGVPLQREMPASRAVAAILGRLLGHVVSNEQGVREQLDVEFLHDYRVAIRRARSILKLVGEVLDADASRSLSEDLSWLATLTSPIRDIDVHLLQIGNSPRDDLDPLRKYLSDRRDVAQHALIAAMESDRYRRMLESWSLLHDGRCDLTAGELADQQIARAYKKVLRRGRAIDAVSHPEALHTLRKRAKELRYLLECFQSLYPSDERSSVVRELKSLQDNLGEYQDCQVQAAAIREMADDLVESRVASARTLMAMGRLAESLEEREAKARAEFEQRFLRFASSSNRKRVHSLVGRAKPAGA